LWPSTQSHAAIHQNGRLNRLFSPDGLILCLFIWPAPTDGWHFVQVLSSCASIESTSDADKRARRRIPSVNAVSRQEVKTKLGLCRRSSRDGRPCEGILDLQRTSAATDRTVGCQGGEDTDDETKVRVPVSWR
jgi:hypothetical protein